MLSQNGQQVHFYHRIIRKLVVAFGTMFNNMRLVKYDKTGTTEIERINVPLMYASKEKFYARIAAAPDPYNPVNLTLPRMAFEMNGISYDPLRKKSNFTDEFAEGLPTGLKKLRMTPYNFDFNLYAFVRNTEDGAQIIEQILPYFTPDYTVTLDFVGIEDFKMDVPLVFNSITYDDSHEGDPESTRSIIWTLNFTAKGYLFGPIANVSVIRKATANIYDNTFETSPLKELELTGGTTDYKVDELVYQGTSAGSATATGFVRTWRTTTGYDLVAIGTVDISDNTTITQNTANFATDNIIVNSVISIDSTYYNVTSQVNSTVYIVDANISVADANGSANGATTLRRDTRYANTIIIYDTNGTFDIGSPLVGAVTGARWNVASFAIADTQLVNITVEPDPVTANTEEEAFGFTTTITEY
jgi:hypothetical protein